MRTLKFILSFISTHKTWLPWYVMVIMGILLLLSWCRGPLRTPTVPTSGSYPFYPPTLRIHRDTLGRQTAIDAAIEAPDLRRYLAQINTRDSLILHLRKQVGKYSRTGTAFAASTHHKGKIDTVYVDTNHAQPVYYGSFARGGKWIKGHITASADSISYDIAVYNEYNLMLDYIPDSTRPRLLRWAYARLPQARLIGYNPFSSTTSLVSIQQSRNPPKRFGIGLQAGFGMMLIPTPTGLPYIGLGPYIGIGASYNLIRF